MTLGCNSVIASDPPDQRPEKKTDPTKISRILYHKYIHSLHQNEVLSTGGSLYLFVYLAISPWPDFFS